jgi:hypothetical protein
MKKLFALVLCLSAFAVGGTKKTPIYVDYQGSDRVGGIFVFQLKETIRKSEAYELADKWASGAIVLDILTVSTDKPDSGDVTAVAVFASRMSFGDPCISERNIMKQILVVGRSAAQTMSLELIADLDKRAHEDDQFQEYIKRSNASAAPAKN